MKSRSVVALLLLGTVTGCLSDPSGPFGHELAVTPEALSFTALGDTARLTAVELGPGATPLPTPPVEYSSDAPGVATVDSTGLVTSRGNGATWIVARVPSGEVDSVPVRVVQQPTGVVAARDTLRFEALGAVQPLGANVIDRLGAAIAGLSMEYLMADTLVAGIGSDGRVSARHNGLTTVRVRSVDESLIVVIQVQQRPVRVVTGSDSLRFEALGDLGAVVAVAVDSLGSLVEGSTITDLAVEDTTVLEVVDSVTVRAKGIGQTVLRFSSAGLPVEQVASVAQVPDTIVTSLLDTQPILSLNRNSLIPIQCRVLDRNGYLVPVEPTVIASSGGRWSGSTCQDLRAQRSGFDTLQIQIGSTTAVLPVTIAIQPIVSNVHSLPLDSMPSGSGPWAPSARRNSLGNLEVYATGYVVDSVHGGFRGHLHRYVSSDGLSFAYDGIALQRDDSLCAPNGSGIENIAIVPRADGPGWRMLYAGGSFTCYGWQVFSAVSSDERTWTKEPGVRISNGLPLSQPLGTVPWPAGEGMVVDQLVSGEWRMIVSTYEPLQPSENKFQITEWRSPDQLSWTYVRTVFSTQQLPAGGQRSVYSPTIREVVPGLWRMIVTADNSDVPGGRSRLWSAVSTDEMNWQLEGELIGAEGNDYLYASLVDNQLVFLHQVTGFPRHVGVATIEMP
jgi:hypothetical protein